jgi:hypothetical protein
MIELTIAMSMLMIAMVSAASATMRMHSLRKQNRERIVVAERAAVDGRAHPGAVLPRQFLDPDTWSAKMLAIYGPGGPSETPSTSTS